MRLTEREIFVWQEDPITGRVVWRYTGLGHGGLLVTLHGVIVMLKLSADSWDTPQMVCKLCDFVIIMFINFWYLIGVVGRCCGYYGEGSGAIHIRQVRCSGSERNITSCSYINNTVLTSHAQDVGVECQQGQCVGLHLVTILCLMCHFISNAIL